MHGDYVGESKWGTIYDMSNSAAEMEKQNMHHYVTQLYHSSVSYLTLENTLILANHHYLLSFFTTTVTIKSYFLLSSPSLPGMSNPIMLLHTSNKQPSKLLIERKRICSNTFNNYNF